MNISRPDAPKGLELRQELQRFVEAHLPAVQRLEIAIESADDNQVVLSAPLAANYNDKGTAFGGSQVLLALSAAWALNYLCMVAAGEKETQFVVADLSMRYLSPTLGERFFAVAQRSDEIEGFIDAAKTGEKKLVAVYSAITSDNPLEVANFSKNSKLTAKFALV